jgi:hypothetical protein
MRNRPASSLSLNRRIRRAELHEARMSIIWGLAERVPPRIKAALRDTGIVAVFHEQILADFPAALRM